MPSVLNVRTAALALAHCRHEKTWRLLVPTYTCVRCVQTDPAALMVSESFINEMVAFGIDAALIDAVRRRNTRMAGLLARQDM